MISSFPLHAQTLQFPGWCRPRSTPPVVCQGPPCLSYKAILRWLPLVLGLEIPRQSQAMNLGWLLLVLGLGLTKASCCLFEKI